ncbi:MAG: TonB-dependent receptor [Sphingomonadales bacterium]|nr:TonB-dependent receptor [Sphingomonadales bacterium]MBU3993199.1 TonB-dependent receptor [Alphaproteobacteria bacterium]
MPRCRTAFSHARLPVLIFAVALSGPLASPAGAADRLPAPDGAEIVITGHGLAPPPAAPAYDTITLRREQLDSSASGRIEDALASVAGFQQFRRSDSRSANPSAQGVTLRALGGNATSRALVLLDGVPLADPFFGYIPFNAIDPALLAGARVTRGGGAGSFGAGAVAGTIELTSAGPGELGRAAASAFIDDRGETTASAALAPRLGAGFAVLSGRWDRGQGFWTTPAAQRVPASVRARYDSWTTGLRVVAPLDAATELQARIAAFDDRRTLRFAGADSSSSGLEASLRVVGRGAWQFEALGYVQARDFTNVVISSSTFRKALDQYATPSTGLGGKLELRPPVGQDHVLRLGADLRMADGSAAEASFNPAGAITALRRAGGRNSDLGLYAEDDWTFGPLRLTAGLRADRWAVTGGTFRQTDGAGLVSDDLSYPDRRGWDVGLRGGAVLRVTRALAMRGAAYSGSRLPTLNELYRPFTVFPVRTLANAALANERLAGFEAGLDFTPAPELSLSLTAFDNRVDHAIANVTIGTNLRERRNIDAIHARGLEFGAQVRAGQASLDTSLALTDARARASGASALLDGLRPAQTPEIAASATLSWNPRPGWRLAATLRHTGAQFEDDLETDELPAATTVSAYASVPLRRGLALVLRAENLTNTGVITRNQAGSLDLGAPRTLWAGLSARLF